MFPSDENPMASHPKAKSADIACLLGMIQIGLVRFSLLVKLLWLLSSPTIVPTSIRQRNRLMTSCDSPKKRRAEKLKHYIITS